MAKDIDTSHLLILTPGFPKDEQDTTCLPAIQKFVVCYQRVFPLRKISIISLQYPHYASTYIWKGIDVYSLGGNNKKGIRNAIVILRAALKAISVNNRDKINGIISFWLTDTSLAGKFISQILGIGHVIWMHGQDAKPGNNYYKRVRPDPEKLIAISDFQNEIFYKSYGIKAKHVVHNGIDLENFPAFNKDTRPIDLFAAGYLNQLKRYDLFIELIKYLKENGFENIKAVLAGDGTLRNELKHFAERYNLEINIEFRGEIPHPEVLKLMNNSKIFIHTSEYEGHSNVLIEALYSGCKVLSFIPVDTKPVDGFILCRDLEDMKAKSLQLLNNQQQYHRGAVYDMTHSVKQIDTILQSLNSSR